MRLGMPLIRTRLNEATNRAGLATGESGFAVPTVLLMVMAAFAVAGVAVTASIGAQKGTSRDLSTKDALAVAEAGVHQALVRYNTAGASETCVAPQSLSGGWCTAATGSLPSGGTFSYWVRPGKGMTACATAGACIEVVSQASVDGVTRRIDVTAHSAAGLQPFIDAGVIGLNGIELASNADITADVASNGEVTLDPNADLCGDAQVGVGHPPPNPASHSCGIVLHGEVSLPPVNQGDVVTNNDNDNFFANTPISGQASRVCWNGIRGDGQPGTCGARELVITHNSALTLPSGNYSFCRLHLYQNAGLYILAGSTVRIYFDSPENCGFVPTAEEPSMVQLRIESNTALTANSGAAVDVVLLFVGSEDVATRIEMASNTVTQGLCEQDFVIYAPRSDLVLSSNSAYCGALAAETVYLSSNAHIMTGNNAQNFTLPNSPAHYVVDDFIECSGPAAGSPDSSC